MGGSGQAANATGAAPGQVARPHLEARLAQAFDRRLTLVVADAGFGKTTLLRSWARDRPCAWYTAARSRAALDDFARDLVDALRVRVPGLAPDLVAALEGVRGPDAPEGHRGDAAAALLSAALDERVTDDLALVVDDVDELGEAGPSWRLLESLCRQAPANVHLLLAGRSEPPFPIERLKGRGLVLELRGADLLLTSDETAAVLAARLGTDDPALAMDVHAATAGWPAAVRLAAEALQNAPQTEQGAVLAALREPGAPLSTYLAAEVFDAETDEVRELVRATVEFARVTPELCTALGFEIAAETMGSLARRGLFFRSGPGEPWFSPSAPVREFARQRLPLTAEQVRALHSDAARWFEQSGYPAEAFRSLLAIDDGDAALRLLRERGRELLDAGAAREMLGLGSSLRAPDSSLEPLLSDACRALGDWDGALARYELAAGDDDQIAPGLALRIGLAHHVRGRLAEAQAAYARGRVDGNEPCEEALLLAWRSAALWLRGDEDGCRRLAQQSHECAVAAADPQALAAAHTALAMVAALEGDRTANEAHYIRALEFAERAGDVFQVIRIRINRGSHYLEEGVYDAALPELEAAIGLADVAGYGWLRALALTNRGELQLLRGRLEEAAADLEAAKTMYEAQGSRMVAYPLQKLGDVYRERGSWALARAAYEQALLEGERSGDVQGLVPSLAGLARVLAGDEPERASALVERALSYGEGMSYVAALIAAGSVALARGDREGALERAHAAGAAARARRDPSGLAEALELEAFASDEQQTQRQRLEESSGVWREIGNPVRAARTQLALALLGEDAALVRRAERRLRSLGAQGYSPALASRLTAREEPAGTISLETLGRFRVLRSGQPIPLAEWKSKKARDLLKILVTRRGRPVPRDLLMETLWPDDDPVKLSNRLSVALSTVRALLDPERRFPSDHFVVAEEGAVGLRRDRISVDVEAFLASAALGLAAWREGRVDEAREQLAIAEAAYTGEYLEEDLYEDWPIALREEARGTYIAVARALAEDAGAREEHEPVARYLLRILERDPYDEPAQLGLVSALVAAKRHGEARRAFRRYCARMEEIGVEPAPYPAEDFSPV